MNFQNCLASRLPPIGTVRCRSVYPLHKRRWAHLWSQNPNEKNFPWRGSFHGFNWDASKIVKKGIQKITLVGGFNPISKKYIAQFGNLFPNYRDAYKKSLSFHWSPTRNQTIPFSAAISPVASWPRRSSRWQGSLVRVMRLMRRLGWLVYNIILS